jgi:4-amino-4-deoxy-L-arabinose transferase-like glycosyltransferase
MKKNISEKFKSIPSFWWILLVILCVGIILRTYNFHDWLRFNADQGRDAEVVSAVVNGNAPLPLLGPKAGGTQFRLGPAFYYFEIASAKIFGNYPDKMAYPDLLTGILCIPLLYFFLRKYFDKNISLALTAIFAVSNYAIRYARFAWNPNSTPFWTLLSLYAMHEVISKKQNNKFLWSAIAGVAIGVGVQLHTTLLLFLPITTIIVFGYLAIKNKKMLKYFFIVLVMSLFINTPQLLNEYQTGGKNIQAFFGGIKTKQQAESTFLNNTLHGTSCWVQGNVDIISGYEISDKCSFTPGKSDKDTLVFVLGAIFVLGGTILGFQYLREETDIDRKLFLGLASVFTGISFLIFLKIAFELSVRFYLILIFLPFFLLGFWIKFFKEKFHYKYSLILLIPLLLLICSNLFFVHKSFAELANYGNEGGGNVDVTILKEAETFSQFIVANSNSKEVYLDGDNGFLFKAIKPIKYLVGRSHISLLSIDKKAHLPKEYFYIGSSKDKDKMLEDPNIKVLQYKTFGEFTIVLIQNIVTTSQ